MFPVTVTLRSESPGNLTPNQVDANFSALAAAVNALYGATVTDDTTARTLTIGDAWKYIRMTGAAASTVTVPPGLSYDVGTEITVFSVGAGGVSFVAGSGVTINAAGLNIAQYRAATLKVVSLNAYDLVGALA